MKLRLHHDSLRLRLGPSDVQELLENGSVTQIVGFSPETELAFCIRSRTEAKRITASIQERRIIVDVPNSVATDWGAGDAVGMDATQDAGDGRQLKISIEKDFQCLHRRSGEEALYPNPNRSGDE